MWRSVSRIKILLPEAGPDVQYNTRVNIPWGDELFWYPSRYPAAGTELIENRWSTKLCCLSVLKQLYFFYFVRIHVRLGSKFRVREMKFCLSYWGDDSWLQLFLSLFSEACRDIHWAKYSCEWVGASYQMFRSRYTLCSNEARYEPCVRVYTFSLRGVQL